MDDKNVLIDKKQKEKNKYLISINLTRRLPLKT